MRWETRLIRETAAHLRRACPLDGPVRVRLRPMADDGRAAVSPTGRRSIALQRGLPAVSLVDALIHEWAHLFAWDLHAGDIEEHGAEWGRAFAEVYTAYMQEVDRRPRGRR